MAPPSVPLVLLLVLLLSLAETPASAPAHWSSTFPKWVTKTERGRQPLRS
ncbi:galanin-like peptide isoform X2 [Gorilla gorilla gorilla]|uniref:Galanin like peptide n=1 Tax=Gorilla gorilla gorilla TaxID=9595 RepID=A0A2I2ZGT0_GORGO